jgi:hypothetical protein
LTGFADLPHLTEIIRTNYDYWKEENEREESEAAADQRQKDVEGTLKEEDEYEEEERKTE